MNIQTKEFLSGDGLNSAPRLKMISECQEYTAIRMPDGTIKICATSGGRSFIAPHERDPLIAHAAVEFRQRGVL